MATLAALRDDAVAAIGNGDYSTAITKMVQAMAFKDVEPDTEKETLLIRWRDKIPETLLELRRLQFASTGVQVTKLERKSHCCDT